MRSSTRLFTSVAAAATLGVVAVSAVSADSTPSASPNAATTSTTRVGNAVGLSSDGTQLSEFPLDNPAGVTMVGAVKGLQGDTKLVGIDIRIANRTLYGVGDQGGIYTVNRKSAKATKVGQLTVALAGTRFGVDFNPAADRLRIISDTGQNLRHDVNPGGATLVDGTVAYTPGTPATGIVAGAYTNNDVSADSGTALFDLDANLNRIAQQVPANDGTLVVAGPLGMDAAPEAGFDIWTGRRDGVASSNIGFATLRIGTASPALYTIDLLSGRAYRVGNFRGADVADLAVLHP